MSLRKLLFAVFFLLAFGASLLFPQETPPELLPAETPPAEEEILQEDPLPEELLEEGEVVQEAELPQEEKEPEASYQSFVDSVKRIRLLATQEDYFTANHLDENGRQLVSYANGKFQRRFYDKKLRLEKVEYWKQGSTAAQSEMEKLLFFNPANSWGIHSIFEQNYAENFEKRSFYFKDGRLKSERKNYFDQDKKLLSFDAASFVYDKSLRLTQERVQKYSSGAKGIRLVSDEIRNSKYNGKNLEETSYYKNSVLRVRTIYQNFEKGDYVKTTYFDGGIIVRDFYRDGHKVGTSIVDGGGNEK